MIVIVQLIAKKSKNGFLNNYIKCDCLSDILQVGLSTTKGRLDIVANDNENALIERLNIINNEIYQGLQSICTYFNTFQYLIKIVKYNRYDGYDSN